MKQVTGSSDKADGISLKGQLMIQNIQNLLHGVKLSENQLKARCQSDESMETILPLLLQLGHRLKKLNFSPLETYSLTSDPHAAIQQVHGLTSYSQLTVLWGCLLTLKSIEMERTQDALYFLNFVLHLPSTIKWIDDLGNVLSKLIHSIKLHCKSPEIGSLTSQILEKYLRHPLQEILDEINDEEEIDD
ncbi:MAG: hypothetical protein HQM12_18080 [SAR324 cluster bacterium]|nr:hypothetical protein [SAR324 cluster bacterium]